jgi:hypothetical protein
MLRVKRGSQTSLLVSASSHSVVDTFTVNPNVGDDAPVGLADRLIGDVFPFYKISQDGGSLLATVATKFRAVNACKPYPLIATSKECIAIVDSNTFCMVLHCIYLFVKNVQKGACVLCYNTICKSPPLVMTAGDFESPRHKATTHIDIYIDDKCNQGV